MNIFRLFGVAFITIILVGCSSRDESTRVREDVILEVTRATKSFLFHDGPADWLRYADQNGQVSWIRLMDYNTMNIWCEFRRLSPEERREMFTHRLKEHRKLREQASEIMGWDISIHGFGLHLSGNEWDEIPDDPQAMRVYRGYLASFGTIPCWER
jgi:hypothetical protein